MNRFKIAFRGDPLVFQDVLYIGEAAKMTGSYKLYVDKASLLVGGGLLSIAIISLFVFRKTRLGKFRSRGVALLVGLLFCLFGSKFVYTQQVYNSLPYDEIFGNRWNYTNQYTARGVSYAFFSSIKDAFPQKPEGYDKVIVEKKLAQYLSHDMADSEKVHVIGIMLEAYADFSQFDQVQFQVDPYENFHLIEQNGYSGSLFTNIFAGGTINTERAFLTGYTNQGSFKKETPSFVRYFRQQGYVTEAMHPGFGWFYNRQNADLNLGFDKFYGSENYFQKKLNSSSETYHGLMTDTDFFPYVMQHLENAASNNQYYFNFSVTYQNHGPYATVPTTDTEFVMRNDQYSEEGYQIFNNYIAGIAKTDIALKALYDSINMSSEPIILVLFGDHKPWQGDGGENYESELGISIDLGSVEGAKNYYQTSYVFYANEAARSKLGRNFQGEGETISPMFLMAELFEQAGWQGNDFLSYLSELKQSINVINPQYLKKNGEYVRNDTKVKEEILDYESVEYYLQYDKKIDK